MTRVEAVSKVVRDYFECLKQEGVLQQTEFNEADCKYLVNKIMVELDKVELEEAAEYANDFLETFQDRKGLQ